MQYMHSHPNVDCYFIKCADPKDDLVNGATSWIEGNTIFVGDSFYKEHRADRILYKTIKAMELLQGKYTHFVRTNLNTFMNLDALHRYNETHHASHYTAGLWQTSWYVLGYGVFCTADVAEHIVADYKRIAEKENNYDLVAHYRSDDACLTSLATGVYPYQYPHPFRAAVKLPLGERQLMTFRS